MHCRQVAVRVVASRRKVEAREMLAVAAARHEAMMGVRERMAAARDRLARRRAG
jgi:hypothetical protein